MLFILNMSKNIYHSKLVVIYWLRNFPVSCVEDEKPCSGYARTLPLIFHLRLAYRKISW